MSIWKVTEMEKDKYSSQELRIHSEAPAEGDAAFDPSDERMHAEEPAEGPADLDDLGLHSNVGLH